MTVVAIVVLLPPMRAYGDDDAATELARRRFATGQFLYDHGRYQEALSELQAAQATLQKPEFDYNIGLCLEKLGRPHEAADALERFVRARPGDAEAPRIWQRIAEMRVALVAATGTAQPASPSPPVQRERTNPPAVPASLVAEPVRASRPPPRHVTARKWWLWTAVGGVVTAGVAIGIGVGLAARPTWAATNPTDGTFHF